MKVNYKEFGEVNLIIDGNNFMFRNFDFTGRENLTTSDGKPTGAVFRTLKSILSLYGTFKVKSIVIAMDDIEVNNSTIRHLLYPLYKSNRQEKPEAIIPQFDYLKECLDAVDIHYIVAPNLYEADDVIGTVAYNLSMNKQPNIIISSDKDMLQLVSNYTAFYCLSNKADKPNTLYTLKSDNPELNIKSITSEFGISPLRFADLKALTGDSSDNIPGVGGVGPKTALPLIQKFKSIENIYDTLHSYPEDVDYKKTPFTKNVAEKLLKDEQMAYLSKELATIHRNIKVNIQLKPGNFRSDNALQVFKKYEFNDFIKLFFKN